MANTSQIIKLKLEPSYMRYYSSDTDFGIYTCIFIENLIPDISLDLKKDDTFIVTGNMPKLTLGKQYIAFCEEVYHPTYGKQYKIQSIYSETATSDEEERNYLASLVSELQYKNITKVYPSPVTAIKDGTFDYTKVYGIGQKTYEIIKTKILKNIRLMSALSTLGRFGISYAQIKKIVDTYSSAELATSKVIENPYLLYKEVDGIGFIKADNIAQTIGVDFNSSNRIEAGIMYSIEQEESKGNTYSLLSDIQEATQEVLGLCIDTLLPFIENNKTFYLSEDKTIVAMHRSYQCELEITEHLYRLNSVSPKSKYDTGQITKYIEELESNLGIKYSDKQKELFYKIDKFNILVMTGYAGTGKTASLNGCLNMMDNSNINYLLLSPTAKSAKVIAKATGRSASTIHRGLQWTPEGFKYNHNNPLPYDLVVVDEVSMVDIWLMRSLLDAIEVGTKILFIGDSSQLESINVGNILQDMIDSDVFPTIKLDKVFRQALESGILSTATSVRQGEKFYTNKDEKLELGTKKDCKVWFGEKELTASRVITVFNMCIKKYPIDDIMIISPMKNGGSGVKILNELVQEVYNPSDYTKKQVDLKRCIFRENDKVMHTKNLYDVEWLNEDYIPTGKTGVFNGDVGTIKEIDVDNRLIYVDYGDKVIEYHKGIFETLDLAYCISVHKSQGSGSRVVIMALDTSHYMNLKRSLVYTGITRASELLFLIADRKALSIAINNDALVYKRTFLKDLIINHKCDKFTV